ncbi:MAG TPA: carbohydrate porin, partial [Desulfobacteria bacterium]|nr:carbohydrate porin [Desulfobacteria bacterium]
GGLNISGKLWRREGDNVGIGYAYVGGGNQGLNYTDVFEIYGRIAVTSIFAVTGDVQYMKDAMAEGDSPEGWIFGLRVTAEF